MPTLPSKLRDDPEYQKLSEHEKTLVLRRLITVYNAHNYRERGDAVRAEEIKIVSELRKAKEKT